MLNTILPGKETVFMSSKMEQIIEEIEDYIDAASRHLFQKQDFLSIVEQLEESFFQSLRNKRP